MPIRDQAEQNSQLDVIETVDQTRDMFSVHAWIYSRRNRVVVKKSKPLRELRLKSPCHRYPVVTNTSSIETITTTPQEFVDESLLLLKARPSSTKITTTYHAAASGKGKLTIKTYDPVSGAVVKFRTCKVAVVGRMVAGLNRLGRQQANVPEPVINTPATDTLPIATPSAGTPVIRQATPSTADTGSKNKKKKKRGKP